MTCGPLLKTLNTSGPLSGYKLFCPNNKLIEDQKKRFSPHFEKIFSQISIEHEKKGLHHNSKGFFSKLLLKTEINKKRSSPQFEGIFSQIYMEVHKRFFVQCPVALWLMSRGFLGGAIIPG